MPRVKFIDVKLIERIFEATEFAAAIVFFFYLNYLTYSRNRFSPTFVMLIVMRWWLFFYNFSNLIIQNLIVI